MCVLSRYPAHAIPFLFLLAFVLEFDAVVVCNPLSFVLQLPFLLILILYPFEVWGRDVEFGISKGEFIAFYFNLLEEGITKWTKSNYTPAFYTTP